MNSWMSFIIKASEDFLTSPLTEEWFDLSQSEKEGFVRENAWYAFERDEPEDIIGYIMNSAESWYFFIHGRPPLKEEEDE